MTFWYAFSIMDMRCISNQLFTCLMEGLYQKDSQIVCGCCCLCHDHMVQMCAFVSFSLQGPSCCDLFSIKITADGWKLKHNSLELTKYTTCAKKSAKPQAHFVAYKKPGIKKYIEHGQWETEVWRVELARLTMTHALHVVVVDQAHYSLTLKVAHQPTKTHYNQVGRIMQQYRMTPVYLVWNVVI